MNDKIKMIINIVGFYIGWATGNRVKKFQKELDSWISQQGLKKIGNFMVAQYNSPWALPPFRHNEIMVRISR